MTNIKWSGMTSVKWVENNKSGSGITEGKATHPRPLLIEGRRAELITPFDRGERTESITM